MCDTLNCHVNDAAGKRKSEENVDKLKETVIEAIMDEWVSGSLVPMLFWKRKSEESVDELKERLLK